MKDALLVLVGEKSVGENVILFLIILGGVSLTILLLAIFAQTLFNRISKTEIPEDLSMRAYKVMTRPKKNKEGGLNHDN